MQPDATAPRWRRSKELVKRQIGQLACANIRDALPRSGWGFEPLQTHPHIDWLEDPTANRGFGSSNRPLLEVHVVPLEGRTLSSRILEQVLTGMPSQVRSAGLVSGTEALNTTHAGDGIRLDVPPQSSGALNSVRSGSLSSVRLLKDGQTAVAVLLPGDQMGDILDPGDATARVASALRLVGQLDMTGASTIAVGVGLTSRSMVTIGVAGQAGRNSAQMSTESEPVHVGPDESANRAALDRGADEVSVTLVRSLIRQFQEPRRY